MMFDFVVSGGVSWQEECFISGGFEQVDNVFFWVERGVIEDNHIAFLEGWQQSFQPFYEEIPVAIAFKDEGCQQRSAAQSGHQIDALSGGSIAVLLCLAALLNNHRYYF